MERLTKKELCDYTTMDFHSIQMDWHSIYNKLAEFEDFMEANDFQEIEQLQEIIERDKFDYLITAPLEQENQTLKGNWAKLKEYVNYFKEYNIEEANMAWKITNKMQELESADGEL